MKYMHEIIIQLPREEVISKMEKPENFKFWQKGFISYQPVSGNHGEVGSRSKLVYKMNGREIEMIETIIKTNLPLELDTTYEAKGLFNIQRNYFEEVSATSTRWVAYSEFRFSGFMKLIGKLMPGTFKDQSLKFMTDFKAFAEEGKSVNPH